MDEGIEPIDAGAIDADLVAMTVITGSANRSYEIAGQLRARGITVVMGGPHVTLIPDDAQPHADAIVLGYAEDTWPELLRDFASGQLRPRYEQSAHVSLSGLPAPRYDLVDGRRYTTTSVVEATRGCIHRCEFCVVPAAWGTRPYKRPVEDVLAEIEARRLKRAIFVDLNLIADGEYALELFRGLEGLRIPWAGLTTALVGRDDELFDAMVRSRCRALLIGFESISTESLKSTRKGFNTPEDYIGLIKRLHRAGVAIQGTFVLGLDHDTAQTCLDTARFAVAAAIDRPRFAVLTPFPGTALHHRLEAEGRILSRDWDLYDGQHVVFQPGRMSPRELFYGNQEAWRLAYSTRGIVGRLGRARVQLPLLSLANLGYRHYARNLSGQPPQAPVQEEASHARAWA
jgi:radical SAM superfamily enzyme YgiQ (UPF0313 family)